MNCHCLLCLTVLLGQSDFGFRQAAGLAFGGGISHKILKLLRTIQLFSLGLSFGRNDFSCIPDMNNASKDDSDSADRAVWFPDWAEVLAKTQLDALPRAERKSAIIRFLGWCKRGSTGVTVNAAKRFVEEEETQGYIGARSALRWFFMEVAARTRDEGPGVAPQTAHGPRGLERREPPPAATDLGETIWERAVIERVRTRSLLWRTEQTYRGWGRRFADFVKPLAVEAAGEREVAMFLTDLAVRGRAGVSTQKQALNALVFILREALGREVGEISFTRSHQPKRAPVVLSRRECTSLFESMEGTSRLMAELAYGSGLRLMELLRLRVKDLDLERGQVVVRAGKGDKDRVTVLPGRLEEPLRLHRERLRGLWEADRAKQLPGVWLPEGLAKKWPQAGETWEWQWLLFPRLP